MKLEKNDLDKFKELLDKGDKILLLNHRRMDGDAYGSLYAFYKLLEKLGKNVKATNDDPIPEVYRFLTDERIIDNDLDLNEFNPDFIISFDVAGIEQFGDKYINYQNIFLNKISVCIDHHPSNPGIGNINLIDSEASSTCELTYRIIKYFDYKYLVDANMATSLLMGIITDTNSFFNTNSSIESFETSGELIELGARHQDIIINLFKKKAFSKIKLWGKVLEGLKSIKENKIVWNIVPKSFFIETGSSDKDITGLLDEFLSTVEGSKVVFLIYELENGSIKATFRSKADGIDLSLFCSSLGGGGHKQARGFIRESGNIYEIEQEVINKLSEYF
ncbi:MAG: bifunctional oligoribonuclease/PAP phosphatase NrnA [Candidatus Gracilibacteria bacterium]|nr:bifunctional oligoribonuclease/PAP phosphatase NrnA [Candidatus Gracilibacteria bacterium]